MMTAAAYARYAHRTSHRIATRQMDDVHVHLDSLDMHVHKVCNNLTDTCGSVEIFFF